MPVLFLREMSYRVHAISVYAFDICAQFGEGGIEKVAFISGFRKLIELGGMTLFVRHLSSVSPLDTRCAKFEKSQVLPSFGL